MTSNNTLKFYNGKRKDYKDAYKGGLYFSTDTFEILYSGQSYAYYPSRSFTKGLVDGSIKDLYVEDGKLKFKKVDKDGIATIGEVDLSGVVSNLPTASATGLDENGEVIGNDGLMTKEDKYNLDQVVESVAWQDMEK